MRTLNFVTGALVRVRQRKICQIITSSAEHLSLPTHYLLLIPSENFQLHEVLPEVLTEVHL